MFHQLTRGGVAALALSLLSACGGGSSDAGEAGTGSTRDAAAATVVSGPISGFGSIIVGGVRFDDDSASVESDDDANGDSADLKLGMIVSVEGGPVDADGRSTATRIRYGSELKGPVEQIDLLADTIVVLGQTVELTASTVFDDELSGGIEALETGALVEIHAHRDAASGHYIATRVEAESDAPTSYRLRGAVSALDTVAKTFQLGGATISYAAATSVPADLADALRVRVELATTPVAGVWQASQVRSDDKGINRGEDRGKGDKPRKDHQDARLHGIVTAVQSASAFTLDGVPVDASGAIFEGQSALLAVGARVAVRGAMLDGVIVATRVKVHDAGDDDLLGEVELHGTISALDTATKTFVLRGLVVDYAGVGEWADGLSEASLVDGLQMEVKGVLSGDQSRLVARRIEADDRSERRR